MWCHNILGLKMPSPEYHHFKNTMRVGFEVMAPAWESLICEAVSMEMKCAIWHTVFRSTSDVWTELNWPVSSHWVFLLWNAFNGKSCLQAEIASGNNNELCINYFDINILILINSLLLLPNNNINYPVSRGKDNRGRTPNAFRPCLW